MTCQHLNFMTTVDVNRMVDDIMPAQFHADISIKCTDCGKLFEFIGLPYGLSPYRPTVSLDHLQLRVPIKPEGKPTPQGLPGFSIRMGETKQ